MIGKFIVSYVARRIPKNFLVDSVDESCSDLVATDHQVNFNLKFAATSSVSCSWADWCRCF